jgi:hypothetical protein
MLVESYAVETVWTIITAVLWAMSNPVYQFFANTETYIEVNFTNLRHENFPENYPDDRLCPGLVPSVLRERTSITPEAQQAYNQCLAVESSFFNEIGHRQPEW